MNYLLQQWIRFLRMVLHLDPDEPIDMYAKIAGVLFFILFIVMILTANRPCLSEKPWTKQGHNLE